MRKVVLLTAVLFLTATVAAQEKTDELHGVIDVTYQSKYIWRGFSVYDNTSAFQPSIDLDLFGTGFGVSMMGHRANSSGYENSERWDYTLYYQNMLCADQPYATMYRFGWVYYNYPNIPSRWADLQELQMVLAWPKILPVKGLVPAYVLVKLWPSSSDSLVSKMVDLSTGLPSTGTPSGFAHIFMLDYGLEVTCPVTNQPRVLKLHSEVVFNDGVGPAGQNVDQDWSDAVFGVSTDVDVAKNLTFTPAINYQITMDESVNPHKDVTWATLSMKYKF
ncbi:MAG: hypothetical protein MUP16_12250 [Sedimentisphaerales bacterium]|nr:hypothetical protein [Sedimentisphaerales bacterium]